MKHLMALYKSLLMESLQGTQHENMIICAGKEGCSTSRMTGRLLADSSAACACEEHGL
jgi:hypothetical protein